MLGGPLIFEPLYRRCLNTDARTIGLHSYWDEQIGFNARLSSVRPLQLEVPCTGGDTASVLMPYIAVEFAQEAINSIKSRVYRNIPYTETHSQPV